MGGNMAQKKDHETENDRMEKKPSGINPNEPDEYGYSSVWE